MTKSAVIAELLRTLNAELDSALDGARATYAAATDQDSKAENKYDTRALEASYLARGQSRRVNEIRESIAAFTALPATEPGAPVAIGSLVTLDTPTGTCAHLIGPTAGGTEIAGDTEAIVVLTPASPLGARLIGGRVGDEIRLSPNHRPIRIIRVD